MFYLREKIMGLTNLLSFMMDSLWIVGGIGAAADLCLGDFDQTRARQGKSKRASRPAGVRGTRRESKPAPAVSPLEGELCWNACFKRTVR
jgi:hypothetical protein